MVTGPSTPASLAWELPVLLPPSEDGELPLQPAKADTPKRPAIPNAVNRFHVFFIFLSFLVLTIGFVFLILLQRQP
jgi:hypothetical protein